MSLSGMSSGLHGQTSDPSHVFSSVNVSNEVRYKPCSTIRPEIRTISRFFELISRFEFEFCRRDFFEGFEFLVRSCECAGSCLCPRISISNVAASAISDHTCIYL